MPLVQAFANKELSWQLISLPSCSPLLNVDDTHAGKGRAWTMPANVHGCNGACDRRCNVRARRASSMTTTAAFGADPAAMRASVVVSPGRDPIVVESPWPA